MKNSCISFFTRLFLIFVSMPFVQPVVKAQIVSSNNLALYKTATASSVASPDLTAASAVDGNLNTRFSSSYHDSEWIAVDLGKPYLVTRIVLTWQKAYGKDYNILFSLDGTYTDLTADSLQIRNHILTGADIAGTDSLTAKSNTIARYVRMQGVHRATAYGYSLFEFQVAGVTSFTNLLPVTLAGFSATAAGSSNLLKWTTTTEFNNSGFLVERSSDGNNFKSLGWVAGVNAGTVVSQYSFIDKQPATGKNYYRLKVIAPNGQPGYSAVVTAVKLADDVLKPYPSPAKDHLMINYKGTAAGNITISLLSATGKPVYQEQKSIQEGMQTIQVDRTAKMLPGLYFLSIGSAAGVQFVTQVVLQ